MIRYATTKLKMGGCCVNHSSGFRNAGIDFLTSSPDLSVSIAFSLNLNQPFCSVLASLNDSSRFEWLPEQKLGIRIDRIFQRNV